MCLETQKVCLGQFSLKLVLVAHLILLGRCLVCKSAQQILSQRTAAAVSRRLPAFSLQSLTTAAAVPTSMDPKSVAGADVKRF